MVSAGCYPTLRAQNNATSSIGVAGRHKALIGLFLSRSFHCS